MRLFGRRSNPQSARSDVPPELQPYYGQPKRRSWLSRARLFILPILAVLVLAGVLVVGVLWARNHKLADLFHKPSKSTTQTARKAAPSNKSGSSQQQPSDATGGTSRPQTESNAQPGTIPNTGPNGSVLLISAATGSLGAVAYHARQLRRVREDR